MGHLLVKIITTGATGRFGKRLRYVSNAVTRHRMGSEETDDHT
jgi:hypothetical protein